MRDGEWEKLLVENRLAEITRLRFWLYWPWCIFTGIIGWILITNNTTWYLFISVIPFSIFTFFIARCTDSIKELKQ
jgi:bacteriorhodopsin